MAFRRFFRLNPTTTASRTRQPSDDRRPARRPGATRDGRLDSACRHVVEALEERRLLTTLSGGQSFEFVDALDGVIRIQLRGDVQLEVIGAEVSRQDNTLELVNLPGVRTNADGSTTVFGGGLDPQGAVRVIGPVGPITGGGVGGPISGTIGCLAAQPDGDNYVVLTRDNPGVPNQTQVLVVQLTLPAGNPPNGAVNGTVVAVEVIAGVTAVTAADFNPGDGLLYFVGNSGDPTSADRVFTIDVDAGSQGAVEASLTPRFVFPEVGANGNTTLVTGITFSAANQIFAVASEGQGNQAPTPGQPLQLGNSFIIGTQTNNPIAFPTRQLSVIQNQQGGGGGGAPGMPQAAQGVTSIEYNPFNNTFVLTGANGGSQGGGGGAGGGNGDVLQLDFAASTAISLGPIVSPAPPNGQIATGQNITGLTFDPVLQDPFSGRTGAFLGYDVGTNQLFFLDVRNRNVARSVYAIYVSHASPGSSIAAGWVRQLDDVDPPNRINPFQGDWGPIRVSPAQGGALILVSPPDADTGALYLGARTQDVIPTTDTEQDLPVVNAQPVPQNVDFGVLPQALRTTLQPGLYSAAGTTIGKFFWGGTLTGRVDLGGSIDQFYAGWLLTGDASGLADDLASAAVPTGVEENFRVAGDIRNLIVKSTIGGGPDPAGNEPNYITGFDMKVGGQIGQINTENAFIGRVNAQNLDATNRPRITNNQREIEYHLTANAQATGFDGVNDPLTGTLAPFLVDPANSPTDARTGEIFSYNDTFETAEYLGSISSAALGRDNTVAVEGVVQSAAPFSDPGDYYAVSLLAGQTVNVQVTSTLSLSVSVFDPDGRLVASDAYAVGGVFRFTPDRPGAYRFAVTGNAAGGTPAAYRLDVTGVGDLGLGALFANNTILNLGTAPGEHAFNVARGDLGIIESGAGAMLANNGTTGVADAAIVGVGLGNLRAIECANIGTITPPTQAANGAQVGNIIDFDVRNGSVGLLRATGASLAVQCATDPTRTTSFVPIAGDFQLVDAPTGIAYGTLLANRSIGVFRAANMNTSTPSVFTVDADDSGRQGTPDGFIDLIDVAGDLGALGPGGPQISHGTGGNVRYIRVLGNLFQDSFFGGGGPETRTIRPNESQTITDDSGALIHIRPTGPVARNPTFNPDNPAGDSEFLGTSTNIVGYGIRSGGEVLVNVDVAAANFSLTTTNPDGTTTTTQFAGGGVEINAEGGAPAEVGRIALIGNGAPVIYDVPRDAFGNPQRLPRLRSSADRVLRLATAADGVGAANTLEVRISGSAPVDVLNIVGLAGGTALGNLTSVVNNSPGGEIAGITAANVGEITSKGTIGVMRQSTPMAVEGLANVTLGDQLAGGARGVLPSATVTIGAGPSSGTTGTADFLDRTRNGILVVGGNVGAIRAAQGLGNIFVQGSIGSIDANDGEDTPGVFEGILAPIGTFSFTGVTSPALAGRILQINIGEGILPGGSGSFARAGIFGYGTIGPITGDRGAVIRGPIHSLNYATTPGAGNVGGESATRPAVADLGGVGIESITLNDGAIVNAFIGVTTERGDVLPTNATTTLSSVVDPVNNPIFDIGRINLNGNGGMIGTTVIADDVGTISVDDAGFGVFTSNISTAGAGRIRGLDVGGYGIRQSFLTGGNAITSVVARGDGSSKSTAGITPAVRISETGTSTVNDPFFDPFFGFEPNTLTDIHAYLGTSAAQPEIPGRTDTGIIEASDFRAERDLGTMRAWQIRSDPSGVATVVNVANQIGTITSEHNVDGLQIVTGRFKTFNLGSDVFNLDLTVAGPLKKFNVAGDLGGNSVIRTTGPAGDMGKISVGGNLTGNVESNRGIKSLFVGKDFTGSVLAQGTGKQAVGKIQVNGAFVGSSLLIKGNVGKITANDLGNFGDTLTVNGSVKQIQVNHDLRASLIVQGDLKKLNVGHSILSGGVSPGTRIDVSGNFDSLFVGADVEQGVVIHPQPRKLKIGGQFLGTYA